MAAVLLLGVWFGPGLPSLVLWIFVGPSVLSCKLAPSFPGCTNDYLGVSVEQTILLMGDTCWLLNIIKSRSSTITAWSIFTWEKACSAVFVLSASKITQCQRALVPMSRFVLTSMWPLDTGRRLAGLYSYTCQATGPAHVGVEGREGKGKSAESEERKRCTLQVHHCWKAGQEEGDVWGLTFSTLTSSL